LPTAALPDDLNLEQLKKQAKGLRDLARSGVPGALELVGAHHPKGAHAVTLTGAQLVVARLAAPPCAPVQNFRSAPAPVAWKSGSVRGPISASILHLLSGRRQGGTTAKEAKG
jgi:hypothetical protein